ncbi:site-specific integrase [Thermococcus sp. LS2]|uniref:site-specific integrase n=1 Tax=Thermococcus sp. LS2 TaxID=1638260 RepID=UPI00143A9A74|nr:site-specific integrase [Thermococcus sp. LS2]NJE11885.1 site-specific integrase [Thermococcus sp. LS2]
MASETIWLRYKDNNVKYKFTSEDIEELLADHTKELSESSRKEIERYIWQFLHFTKTKKLVKGKNPKAPEKIEVYEVSEDILREYVDALSRAGYGESAKLKRMRYVKMMLRLLGAPAKVIEVLDVPLRKTKDAWIAKLEDDTPDVTIEDAREFFARLEKLFESGKLSESRYVKAVVFALLLFSTGRRVSEVAQITADMINIKLHQVKFEASKTKEGRLRNATGYFKIAFLTREAELALKFYLTKYREEIEKRGGYLFIHQNKKYFKDTFLHKIIKENREIMKFEVSDGIHEFEPKFFRKIFAQEWRRQAEAKGIANDRVLTAGRKIMGHSPVRDVHNMHYDALRISELWKYYKHLYYDLRVLTPKQRKLFGIDEGGSYKEVATSNKNHGIVASYYQIVPGSLVAPRKSQLAVNYLIIAS